MSRNVASAYIRLYTFSINFRFFGGNISQKINQYNTLCIENSNDYVIQHFVLVFNGCKDNSDLQGGTEKVLFTY